MKTDRPLTLGLLVKRIGISIIITFCCLFTMPSCTSNGTNNKIKYNDKTEYEVCSVMEYIENETNGYGGILNTYSCYSFTYIDDNGDIQTIDNFRNNPYGYTHLKKTSKSNKYVIDGSHKYLYLTKETLNGLSSSNSKKNNF